MERMDVHYLCIRDFHLDYGKGVKCALSLMGICSDTLAAPREPFNETDRELIRQRLVELGAL